MPNHTYIAKVFTKSPADAVIRLNGSAVRVGDRDLGPWIAVWYRERNRVKHFRVSETVADLKDLLADGWRLVTKAVAGRFIGRIA